MPETNLRQARFAVLLSGPIGVGKSTLAQALAARFDGAFIEGDDYKTPCKPWFASSLSTCNRIFTASCAELHAGRDVFIARPVRCLEWIWFCRRFAGAGVRLLTVGLQASESEIVGAHRGRVFSPAETERISVMIRQGYGAQEFCDVILSTQEQGLAETIEHAADAVRQWIACPNLAVQT